MKKTQEELDEEMASYFGGGSDSAPAADAPTDGATGTSAAQPGNDDIDMIE